MRTFIKRVRLAVEQRNADGATDALKTAIPLIDRCAQKGVIPKKRASRLVSRLTHAVGTLASQSS